MAALRPYLYKSWYVAAWSRELTDQLHEAAVRISREIDRLVAAEAG